MSKITDIFSNILKLDPSKEYEFTVSEQKQETPAPVPPVPPTPPAPPVETVVTNPPAPTISTAENQDKNIAELQKQVQSLQAANLALLNRLPVQEKEKSTEELIYELCVGIKKGETNGINQTGSGIESRSQSNLSYC